MEISKKIINYAQWKYRILQNNIHNFYRWKRESLNDPNLRNYQQRLSELKSSYHGNRCFIMGNGPSINCTPLEKLQNEYVWGLNRCNLLFERINWRPKFYTAVDTRVVPDNSHEINTMINELHNTLFFFPLNFRSYGILISNPNTFWYKEITLNEKNLPDGYFSINVSKYVRAVRTVTIAAIQLAVHLGFNPIYLIGCDTNYRVPETAIYEDKEKYKIIASGDDDMNHFSINYFGVGKKYHQPHPEKMIFAYQQTKVICDRINVSIINATVGGSLEVFPRINFEELF